LSVLHGSLIIRERGRKWKRVSNRREIHPITAM